MRSSLRLTLWAILAGLLASGPAFAQGYIYSQPVLNSRGAMVPGANVAVCTTVASTAASVTNNIATLTMASNPVTGGFTQGSTLIVSQFTGSDTYFNGTYTIAAISTTTISYGLTHANASATTNGVAVQRGTSSTACAPLATIYTDQTLAFTTPNPFTTDAFGNLTFSSPSQNVQIQIYGSTVTLSLYTATIPCPSAGACNPEQFAKTNWYADQYCAGSLDVGLCINNTLAAIPTIASYKYGTIRLDGFAAGTAWVWNTLVTISSPGISIKGPGSAALQITASVLTGDHLRIQTSPFIASLAGEFEGFSLVGGSQSNAVCIHLGDIIGAELHDIRCSNFSGTGAVGLWMDNVTTFTERTVLDKVHMDSNTKGIKLTNTGAIAGTASFGHQRWLAVMLNVGANQTGLSYESGTFYSDTINLTINESATTSTGIAISGLAYTAGPATAMTGSNVTINAETGAGSGTFFNVGSGSSCLLGGMVTTAGGLTNTGAGIGSCNMYMGNALTGFDLSNMNVAAGTFVIGGVPGASGLPQFLANSSSTIAGVTASNYYLLRSGVAGLEAHDTSGNVGIAGKQAAVSGYTCATAGGCDLGTAALPFANLWLGTAATNNFKIAPLATTGARVLNVPDWGIAATTTQNQPFVATLTSQYTNSTTGFTNVTGGNSLSFAVAASTNYTATCHLYYQAAATGGLNIEFTGPASPTSVIYGLNDPNAATTFNSSVATSFSSSLGQAITTATTNFDATVSFSIINGANAGTVQMLAKSSAAAQLQIQAGSYCVIQ